MAMFWTFFTFELRFHLKSISTYVYFLLWFTFSFLCVASESFGPIGFSNGKVLPLYFPMQKVISTRIANSHAASRK